MLKLQFALLCLLVSSGCASGSKKFEPIDNCVADMEKIGQFACVGEAKYSVDWLDAKDLICMHTLQFKTYNETCHEK